MTRRRLLGLRPVAGRVRLRRRPPDEPGPGRPHDAAGRRARRGRGAGPAAGGSTVVAGPGGRRRPAAHRARRGATSRRSGGPARTRPASTSPAGSAPRTTRPSRGCTTRRPTSSARPSRRPAGCGPARRCTRRTSPAGCTTRCPTGPAASASTTTSRSAIRWLLDQGAERVAYVDVDVHHGDGVETVFYDDPRVLTISLHETGQMLFPGTGFPDDTGGPGAEGSAVNVALPPGHRRRRLAAGLPRGRAAAAARVRARRPGHPARLRLPHRGPAGAPDADRRRPARVVPRAARPGARGLRRPVGGDRRRRLRRRRRRAARLDPPARRSSAAPPLDPATRGARRGGATHVAAPARAAGAAADDRRAARSTATGRRGTTPTPGWTGRSTPPGRRSSRCTGWTRCPEPMLSAVRTCPVDTRAEDVNFLPK